MAPAPVGVGVGPGPLHQVASQNVSGFTPSVVGKRWKISSDRVVQRRSINTAKSSPLTNIIVESPKFRYHALNFVPIGITPIYWVAAGSRYEKASCDSATKRSLAS